MAVPGVAVADDDALVAGQHPAGVDRPGRPVAGMQAGQVAGAGQVDVPGPAGRAGRGLIGADRRGGLQQIPDAVGEPAGLHQGGGPAADPGHPPGRDRHAGELAQQHGGPVDGDVVAADQVRGLRAGFRPVTGPRPHTRGKLPGRHRPAARALLRLRHVLHDLRRRCRLDVGDLVTALRHHRYPGQVRAALAARRGRALDRVVRIICQIHRQPGIARLLSRPSSSPFAQRPVAALLPVRAIRRRGTRRRGRVLTGLPLQFLHPGRKPLDLPGQLSDQPVRLRQPHRQFSSRKTRQILRRRHISHPAIITIPASLSTTRPGMSPAAAGPPTSRSSRHPT